MTYPTLENGPYIFNVNNLFTESTGPDHCKRMLLELKNALKALGGAGVVWDVVASSDSSGYVNKGGGSPDLWTDITDVIPHTAGSAHSWIILENQTTGAELLIDYAYGSTTYDRVIIQFSPGGNFTADGDASNAPTATDAQLMYDNDKLFSNDDGGYTKFVMNVMCSADKKTTRWYWHEKNDASAANGGMVGLIEEVQNTPSEWNSTYKTAVLFYNYGPEFSTTPNVKSPNLTRLDDGKMYCRYVTSEPYSDWISSYLTMEGYRETNGYIYGFFYNNVEQGLVDGYPINPIGLFREVNPKGGSLGRLRDIYFGQNTQDTLSTYPADASRLWIKWGALIVPWDGSAPLDAV